MSSVNSTPTPHNKRKSDDEPVVGTSKKQKGSGMSEALKPFTISTHWVEHAYVKWRMESVEDMKEERLVVLHVLCMAGANAGSVGGVGSKFDLRTVSGMGDFLTKELGVQSAGLNKIENQAKGGAKWLVHMKLPGMGRMAELAEIKKLGHGIGIKAYVLPLMKTRSTIKVSVDGWPTWWTEDAARSWIEEQSWCRKVTEPTRVAVEGSPVDKVTCLLHLPEEAVDIEQGKGADDSDDLYLIPDWKISASVRGHNITVHRAPSCAFCGDDSHVVTNCELVQRCTSESMPLFKSIVPSSVAGTQMAPDSSAMVKGSGDDGGSKAAKQKKDRDGKKKKKST